MALTIRIRRDTLANLPISLALGEMFLATDVNQAFYGDGSGICLVGNFLSGLAADKPSAAKKYQGIIYYETDTLLPFWCDGSSWVLLIQAAAIPNLDAAKITSGTLGVGRIPSIPASQTTSGTFDAARIPSLVASGVPTWLKVATIAYNNAALTVAALTADLEVYSLPIKGVVHAACVRPVTGFGGGTIATIVASIGISGVLAKYLAAASIAGAVQFGSTNLTPVPESFSGTTSIRLALTSTIGLLNALSAGSLEVYLLVATLP